MVNSNTVDSKFHNSNFFAKCFFPSYGLNALLIQIPLISKENLADERVRITVPDLYYDFIQISIRKATVAALQKLSGLTNRDKLMELLDGLGVFEQSTSTTTKKLEGAHDLNKRNEVCIH